MHKPKIELLLWSMLWVIPPIITGFVSLSLGRDVAFDLRNYHFYNAYAFLHNRLNYDIAPAGFQSFFNPALDLPVYWLMRNFSSRTVGFVLGFVQGLSFPLLFLIYWRTCLISSRLWKLAVGLCVLALALVAPAFIGALGTALGDDVVVIFAILSVLALILASENHGRQGQLLVWSLVAAGGVAMGAAVGLKQVMLPYALGSAIALPFLFNSWRDRTRLLGLYAIAGLVGGLLASGFWLWRLWHTYGNPVFPFLNSIFASPFASSNWYDSYYSQVVPRGFLDHVLWPFQFFKYYGALHASTTTDIRFSLVYLLFVAWLASLAFRRVHSDPTNLLVERRAGNFLLVFFWLSFVLWMELFSAYRYLIALELVLPLVILIIIGRALQSTEARLALGLMIFLTIFATYKQVKFAWRLEWTDRYFQVDPFPFTRTQGAVVLLMGHSPFGYIIPFMPPEMRFVRPDWDWDDPARSQQGLLYQEATQLLMDPGGPRYVIYNQDNFPDDLQQLNQDIARFALLATPQECKPLQQNVSDRLMVCRLSHAQ